MVGCVLQNVSLQSVKQFVECLLSFLLGKIRLKQLLSNPQTFRMISIGISITLKFKITYRILS